MKVIRLRFLKLNVILKEFGRTRCKYHRNRTTNKTQSMECHHPMIACGGVGGNTTCELTNCPRTVRGRE